jgi:hypothetical protein
MIICNRTQICNLSWGQSGGRERMASDLKLYYADLAVGTIKNPFQNDDTWFGIIDLDPSTHEGQLAREIAEYIRFVEGWNERVNCNEHPDPDEFNQYSNLVKSGLWSTRDEKGNVNRITDAPIFCIGGEVSWRTN